MRNAPLATLVLALAACGGSGDVGTHGGKSTSGGAGSGSTGGSTTGSSTTGGGAGTTGGATSSGTSGGTTGSSDGCSDAAKLVYVVDVDNGFYAFQAGNSPSFTRIGTLSCPAPSGETPFSMSVDRNATAWVLYSDGEIFNVSTADAHCTATAYQSGQHGFTQFGMGFVADSSGATTDTLFVGGSGELGTLNTSTLKVTDVGPINGWPELTGTGTAQLWGFYPDPNNPRVSQIDKTSGNETTSFPLDQLAGNPEDWAFAFWGGDFWVFLKRDTDSSINVWRVDANGNVTEVMHDTGKHIVGAGVSTCAPVVFQ